MTTRVGSLRLRRLMLLSVVAALVLAMPALADQRYRDATKESSGAADISSVIVSNDATTGDVEFTVIVTSNDLENKLVGRQITFDVFIDADHNRATGNARGFDVEISTDEGVSRWNGKEMSPENGSFETGFSTNSMDFSIPGKRILVTRPKQTFDFLVVSHRMSSGHDVVDVAPNHGVYTYTLAGPPPPARVVSTAVAVTVSSAAGQLFELGPFSLGLSDGTMITATDERCKASIAGAVVPSLSANDCSWRLPKTSRGKDLVVIVSGHYRGRIYTKRLTYPIA